MQSKLTVYLATLLVFLGVAISWFFLSYNYLVSADEKANTAWGAVEVQYQRRYDLIPNLTEATKAMMEQEERIFADIAQARGQAESTKLRAAADAEAIRIKSQALSQNPGLVELTAAEKWNGVLPTTMVPGSALPFLNIK